MEYISRKETCKVNKKVIPAQAGIQKIKVTNWIPVFTGMTDKRVYLDKIDSKSFMNTV